MKKNMMKRKKFPSDLKKHSSSHQQGHAVNHSLLVQLNKDAHKSNRNKSTSAVCKIRCVEFVPI